MILDHRTYVLHPGKLREFLALYEAEGFPVQSKHLGKPFAWFTTEVGRQPWVVYGLMRTKDAVSLHGAPEVGLTLILFVLIYCAVFGTGIGYLLRQIRLGPVTGESAVPEDGGPGREKHPMRPLSVVTGPEEDVTGDGKA